jgi:hypothetical protein
MSTQLRTQTVVWTSRTYIQLCYAVIFWLWHCAVWYVGTNILKEPVAPKFSEDECNSSTEMLGPIQQTTLCHNQKITTHVPSLNLSAGSGKHRKPYPNISPASTSVSTLQSSVTLWPPRFCCNAGNQWQSHSNKLASGNCSHCRFSS